MKLIFLLTIVFTLQVRAGVYAQKITLSENGASLDKLFKTIKKQSGYTFFYKNKLLKNTRPVTISVKDADIKDVLDQCFKGQSLSYEFAGKIIVIKGSAKQQVTVNPSVSAINITVKGTVNDEKGLPLPGATVRVKGGTRAVTTNENGEFTIANVPDSATLVISFSGFKTREISVKEDLRNIRLSPLDALSDVVIVGYGTQKRERVTGAIAAVGTKELQQSPVANLSNALAGRLPGLLTVQNSGEPGADGSNLNIRGFGTTNNAAPLVLVDGIQRDFSGLDPNEVESVSILKDAASTAIYGIQGANGVILVTTKRGKNGVATIAATAQNGWQSPTSLPQYVDSYTGRKLYKEGLINDGRFSDTSAYTDAMLNKYRDRTSPAYEYLYPNVNWTKAMLKRFSYLSQANLNVSGGGDKAKYFISLSYLQQNGLYNYEETISQYDIQAITKKYNFRSNIDLALTNRLSMELNLGAIVLDRNYPGVSASDIFNDIKQTPAWYYPILNPDGSPGAAPNTNRSPYVDLTQTGYQRLFDTQLQSTAGFKWDMGWLTKGLSSRVRLSFDNQNYRNVNRALSFSTYQFLLNPGVPDTETDLIKNGHYVTVNNGNGTLDYQVTANGSRRTVFEAYINYDRDFGKHSVKAMGIYNQTSFFNNVGGGAGNAKNGLPYKYQGYLGRVAYAYNDKYLAEFNFGYNGSENFAPGHRFGFFPAVSAGWLISNENFIKNNTALTFIDQIKIRGSYGIVGNDKIAPDPNNPLRFLYLSTWVPGSGYTFGLNNNGNGYDGYVEGQAGNMLLTWEKARKLNIGFDLSLWRGGLSVTADVFRERRTNILATSQLIPSFIGLPQVPAVNAGITENKGYEISLTHRHDFNSKQGYSLTINYAYARNKILFFAQPDYPGREWQALKGTSINEIYGYTAVGLFKSQEDINNSPSQSSFGVIRPGDIKYQDLNQDGIINSLDAGYLPGKVANPTSQFGIALGYHYSNFDVSVLLQGGLGGSTLLSGSGVFPFSRFASALEQVVDNHWVPSNPDGDYMFPRISANDNVNNQQASTFWIYSSNYIRLKTVELGYTLPKRWMKKISINNARLFVNGINLLTWSKLKDFNFDPEIGNNGTGTYPQQKVLNAGLRFTF
ncbi:TonB-dependent receptor [Mucilaginibacter sp. Bleaf8]|uniref:TonB-dependent receptor n=1 Tax=Mucilaginibacter sp. Bleaf8 TaxID=2834430 RepID=UPI001BCFAD9D|nr:TonB-dependent receptor [Mucilaginibacter sp. Bleaf8]MBS7562919.1 TonB-dependent receptor [Mucilaginibacter sp. Bleaf8]